jgi:uncharacterized membrane protein
MNDNPTRVVALVLLGWLCFAIGLSGWFRNATAPAVALTVWTSTALVLLPCWKLTPIRVWALNIDLRWLALFHVARLFCRHLLSGALSARPSPWSEDDSCQQAATTDFVIKTKLGGEGFEPPTLSV